MDQPKYADGKICYIEIPAIDSKKSSEFFHQVFNWNIRQHDDGSLSFDDAVNEVSGTWVEGKQPSDGSGLMVHLMTFDFNASLDKIKQYGGKIKEIIPIGDTEKLAHFNDPAGNVFGLYQHG